MPTSKRFPHLGLHFNGLQQHPGYDNDPHTLCTNIYSQSTKDVKRRTKLTYDELTALEAQVLAHLQAAEDLLAAAADA